MGMKMSDVIDFLERMGGDATLRRAPLAAAMAGVGGTGLSAEVRAALVSRDQQALAALLGSKNVCCMVNVPIQEEERVPEPQKSRAA
jgi:hypothetical protein